MSRADDAIQRLYENADLRDELTDDEADTLFKWAEGEIARLDQSGTDDAAFDAQVVTLMDMLKGINRYAGRQGQASAQTADPLPAEIANNADALGYTASLEQIAAAGTGNPSSTIAAITGLLAPPTPAEPPAAPPAHQPSESAAESSPEPPKPSESTPLPPSGDTAE